MVLHDWHRYCSDGIRMTDEELLTLVAKDYLVKTHQFGIRLWTEANWWAAIENVMATFTDETLKNARIAYPDA